MRKWSARVDDQDIDTLLQEGVDLLGLGVLVVLAVHDGDGVAHVLQVLFQIGAVQGHEVISKLIDAHADVCGTVVAAALEAAAEDAATEEAAVEVLEDRRRRS